MKDHNYAYTELDIVFDKKLEIGYSSWASLVMRALNNKSRSTCLTLVDEEDDAKRKRKKVYYFMDDDCRDNLYMNIYGYICPIVGYTGFT